MSCGCGRRKIEPRQAERERGAMCHLCPMAERDTLEPWAIGAVRCTISGLQIQEHTVAAAPCPLGMHPDAQGLVRWAWLIWYGVPDPIRLALANRLTGPLPGCGCVKYIKDIYVKESATWRALAIELWSSSRPSAAFSL